MSLMKASTNLLEEVDGPVKALCDLWGSQLSHKIEFELVRDIVGQILRAQVEAAERMQSLPHALHSRQHTSHTFVNSRTAGHSLWTVGSCSVVGLRTENSTRSSGWRGVATR